MKDLFIYITESLKKVGEYRDKYTSNNDHDKIQILERKIKPGSLTDDMFKDYIMNDINECFNLSDSTLNKEFDKVIEDYYQSELNRCQDYILHSAETRYKSLTRRNRYIQDEKDKIYKKVVNDCHRYVINRIFLYLNPGSDFGPMTVTRDGKVNSSGSLSEDKIADVLLETFKNFGNTGDGDQTDLRDHVTGWRITYSAYKDTVCPNKESAYLELMIDKKGESIIKQLNNRHADALTSFYKSGRFKGYVGD